MLAQMIAASPAQSAAFDEGYTITYGYAYLHTGDARLSRGQNPPLTNVIIALPLLLRNDIAFPTDHPTWAQADIYGFSDEFLWKANADPQRLLWLARLPAMMLALLLASTVYAFTQSLFGDRAALAALFLCAFDPNSLAYGHIAGTDLGVTFFMFAAVWLWTAALKRMSVKRAIAAGLMAGAALATKYSAVWLVPIVIVLGLAYSGLNGRLLARLKLLLILGCSAFVVIWATFGFSIGPIASGAMPAPQYWASLGNVANRVESSTPAFMLGRISSTGFLLYYPFVLLIKTPLPTLILLAFGVASLIARRKRQDIAAWFPPLLFLLAAMVSGLNLGYRLILPVLPFMLMIAGHGASVLVQGVLTRGNQASARARGYRRAGAVVVGVLGLWLVIDTLSNTSSQLAYFNQLAGDRSRDYELLVDSNLDWGQDLIALREWQTANHADHVNLAYYGTAHPEAYGVSAHLLPSFTLNDFNPEVDGFSAFALPPGWYAVSATSLQLGTLYTHWQMYAPFRARQPDARAGRSILLYHVDYPTQAVDRAIVLGPSASDLDQTALGGSPDRQLIVKWAGPDAAVMDMQGPARYITRGGDPLVDFVPGLHDALLAQAEKLGNDASGKLRLFTLDARPVMNEKMKALRQDKVLAPDGSELTLPIQLEGGLSLIGYDLTAEPGKPIDLAVYLRVDQIPLAPRLSVFAHMLDESGQIVAQRDGLNVRLSSLEPGDVILQHFTIERPDAARHLAIGLYDPATGQRMKTSQALDSIVIPLQP